MKFCASCQQSKGLMDFHNDASKKDGLASTCKPCARARAVAAYGRNKEKAIARALEWVANNRDLHNKKCNAWAKKNKAAVNARTARRYASKTQATPKFVLENADFLWMIREAYHLAKLREQVVGGKWEVDHIVPLRGTVVSGLHAPWNLQVVPMTANRRKSNSFQVAA